MPPRRLSVVSTGARLHCAEARLPGQHAVGTIEATHIKSREASRKDGLRDCAALQG